MNVLKGDTMLYLVFHRKGRRGEEMRAMVEAAIVKLFPHLQAHHRSVNLKTMRGQCSVEGLAFTSFTCLIIKNRICIYLVRLNLIIKVIICK